MTRGAQRAAEQLARTVDEVLDGRLRASFVRHQLSAMPTADAVDVLLLAQEAAERGDERGQKLLLTASVALAPEAASPLRAMLADAALERRYLALARMLQRDVSEADATLRVPDFGLGRPLTLGERKSLARRLDRLLLARVLADRHPEVIRLLLGNPMLIESDVVRLAARRPLAPEVAREIAGSWRWMVRGAVQRALVKNPYVPRDVTLPLVALLRGTDLAELAVDETLAPSLREAARRARARPLPD